LEEDWDEGDDVNEDYESNENGENATVGTREQEPDRA
jgi:hypothetical protein